MRTYVSQYLERIRAIVPVYITPHTVIPFTPGKLAMPRDVLTNPTDQQESAALAPIKGKRVGMVGAGSQALNQARCLVKEGIQTVIIGRDPGSASMKAAAAEGFQIVGFQDIPKCDVLAVGIPDDQQVLRLPEILRGLPNSPTLMFFHGMSVHYGRQGFYGSKLQDALKGWNIAIAAPKAPGNTVWANKEAGGGVACLYGAHEESPDYDGTLMLAKAYAAALGGYRGAMLQTNFPEETETDHFGEQGVLCGVLQEAVFFMTEFLVRKFNKSLAFAQSIVENELIHFGDMVRRGGADYVLRNASPIVRANMRNFGAEFYGVNVTDDDLRDNELEEVGRKLRALQPHLSPVTASGEIVCGNPLPAPPVFFNGLMGGGIAGILLAASACQYRIGREAGYTSEGLQFEVQQEISLLTDCVRVGGLGFMGLRISTTANHGMYTVGRFLADSKGMPLYDRFGTVLGAIQRGDYARRTMTDLVDTPRGSDGDWLWRAKLEVINSPEEAFSARNRPAARPDFRGVDQPCLFIDLGDKPKPWSYSFRGKSNPL